ncbi:MAG TPA: DedA family protein [Bacteroidales bacterium]|nr:DedA family protein [Bacteroidales bacterium]HSA43308.1 DedA family protein [Bacteroidales bacterium]
MDWLSYLIDFILHIDKHLFEIVTDYQTLTYLILFLIVFCETGLVITPFLPGDSLLFAAGTIAAMPGQLLEIKLVILTFFVAAFIGDNTNYWIGHFLGGKVYEKNYRLIRRKYLDQTHAFYEKHGGKTIVLARFMPIIRTFAPFVAGVGTMNYRKFVTFSILGNIIWTNIFCLAGYFFGNIPFVQNNFTMVILAIIAISLVPPVIAALRPWLRSLRKPSS